MNDYSKQGNLHSPEVSSSLVLDTLLAFTDPRHQQHGHRVLGRPPKPRSEHLAGPGCAAAFRISAASHVGRNAREPSGSSASTARSERQADPRSPGAGSSPSWMRCRPSRILSIGRTVRDAREASGSSAPAARSAPPGGISEAQEQAARLPGCAVGLPGSSESATRSETPGRPPDLRHRLHGLSTRQISRAQERAARPPGCAAAFRIPAAGRMVRAPGRSPKH